MGRTHGCGAIDLERSTRRWVGSHGCGAVGAKVQRWSGAWWPRLGAGGGCSNAEGRAGRQQREPAGGVVCAGGEGVLSAAAPAVEPCAAVCVQPWLLTCRAVLLSGRPSHWRFLSVSSYSAGCTAGQGGWQHALLHGGSLAGPQPGGCAQQTAPATPLTAWGSEGRLRLNPQSQVYTSLAIEPHDAVEPHSRRLPPFLLPPRPPCSTLPGDARHWCACRSSSPPPHVPPP